MDICSLHFICRVSRAWYPGPGLAKHQAHSVEAPEVRALYQGTDVSICVINANISEYFTYIVQEDAGNSVEDEHMCKYVSTVCTVRWRDLYDRAKLTHA